MQAFSGTPYFPESSIREPFYPFPTNKRNIQKNNKKCLQVRSTQLKGTSFYFALKGFERVKGKLFQKFSLASSSLAVSPCLVPKKRKKSSPARKFEMIWNQAEGPSFLYTKISPGWQSSTSQIASRVENRMAFTLPVFSLERFTFAIPTLLDNSFNDIFRSDITRLSLRIIGIVHLKEAYRIAPAIPRRGEAKQRTAPADSW